MQHQLELDIPPTSLTLLVDLHLPTRLARHLPRRYRSRRCPSLYYLFIFLPLGLNHFNQQAIRTLAIHLSLHMHFCNSSEIAPCCPISV